MSWRAPRGWLIAAAALAILLALPAHAGATEIVVTSFADDFGGDDGKCSLREAVAAANNTSTPSGTPGECPAGAGSSDTITLPAGTYTMFHALPTINSARPLTIAGAGAATTTITQAGSDRFFRVATGVVVIQDITMANGHPAGGLPELRGGAIYNLGNLTILRCVLTGNHTVSFGPAQDRTGAASSGVGNAGNGDSGGDAFDGGAILNAGPLTIRDSTFSGNYTGDGGDGGDGTGGAGNFGTGAVGYEGGAGRGGAGGGGGSGGAIFSVADLVIERTVFAGNHTGDGGSGGTGVGGPGGKGGGVAFAGGQGGSGIGGAGGHGGAGGAVAIVGPAFGPPRNFAISGSEFIDNFTGNGGTGGSATGGAGGQGGDGGIGTGGAGGAGRSGTAGSAGSGGTGGAISGFDSRDLSVTASAFEGNTAGTGGEGAAGTGGVGGPGGAAAFTGPGGPGGAGNGSAGGAGGMGGAMWSDLKTLANATLTQNAAGNGANGGNGFAGAGGTGSPAGAAGASTGGDAGDGGGVGGARSGSTVTHVTVSSNAVGTAGSPGSGGTPGTAGAAGTGGGFYGRETWTLDNSVVASNTGGNCGGIVSPTGAHNVSFPDASCPGTNADPKLAALADNGGPTKTQALGAGSAARDLVPAAGGQCAPIDQRGVVRPQVAACDAGAYEAAPPSVTTGAAGNVAATSASLAGSLNPNLLATTFHFEFGPTAAYGTSTSSENAGAGNGATDVAAPVSGLTHSTTYHYRLVASNADGSTSGADQTFTTAPAGGGTGDSIAPVISSASMRPGRVKPRTGSTLTYVLSEAAHLAVTVERVLPGRRVKGRCVRVRPSNLRKRKCKRYTRAGSFAADGAAGSNAKRFSGVFRGKALKRGRYRATLVATDAAGNRSRPRRVTFSIVARR